MCMCVSVCVVIERVATATHGGTKRKEKTEYIQIRIVRQRRHSITAVRCVTNTDLRHNKNAATAAEAAVGSGSIAQACN